jgi:hypothetical protein
MGLARIIGKKKWHTGAFSCIGSVGDASSRASWDGLGCSPTLQRSSMRRIQYPLMMRLAGAIALAGRLSLRTSTFVIDRCNPDCDGQFRPAQAHERRSKSRCVVRRSAAPGIPESSTTFRRRIDRARNSQRARRAQTACEALHAADCWASASSACSCRATIARKATLR